MNTGSNHEERRSSIRTDTSLPVDFTVNYDYHIHEGKALNFSEGGLFLRTPRDIQAGAFISLSVPVYGKKGSIGPNRIIIKAKIVHVRTDQSFDQVHPFGMGVEFANLEADDWGIIHKTISRLKRESVIGDGNDSADATDDALRIIRESLPAFKEEVNRFFNYGDEDEAEVVDSGEVEVVIQEESRTGDDSGFDESDEVSDKQEGRRHKRTPLDAPAQIRTRQGEAFVQVFDISESGVGFICKNLINEYENLEIALSVSGLTVGLQGRIARRKLLGATKNNPMYGYGMHFTDPKDSFLKLMASLAQKTHTKQATGN